MIPTNVFTTRLDYSLQVLRTRAYTEPEGGPSVRKDKNATQGQLLSDAATEGVDHKHAGPPVLVYT